MRVTKLMLAAFVIASAGISAQFFSTSAAPTTADDDTTNRLNAAAEMLNEILTAPDKGVPQDLLDKSACAVIVPNAKKGAFIVGAKYGRGFIVCRREGGRGWSAPGGVRVEGGSVGFQIGGSETDVLMLVMNQAAIKKLLSSKFTLGGDASAAAGPVGRTLIPLPNDQSTLKCLSKALTDWTQRGSWCEKCNLPVRDGSCSNCSVIPPNPRSSLIEILTRLGVLDTEELLHYSEDPWHSVRDVAYELLSKRATAEPDLLKLLLARIKKGLKPYELSTAVNLLYTLLRLPSAVLRAVESNLLELSRSDVAAIREVIISSLTSDWVPSKMAMKLAKEAMSDPSPRVRSTATKTLRLLHDD